MVKKTDLIHEIAQPSLTGLRNVWQWRPLASLSPRAVADILRRAAAGDATDFLLAADDVAEKDLHYRAVLQTRRLAIVGLPWEIHPADDTPTARRAAELVQEALEQIDLPDLVDHLMDAVPKGFAVAEIVWETAGSLWRPARILPRPAHWFTFDRTTGSLLRLADGSLDGEGIPPLRMILHAPNATAKNPYTAGVARSALWAWVFKSYGLRDWARFIELFGQPIRLGKYHQGATPEDVAVLKQAAFALGSDAAAVIPQEMLLELVESGSKSASADLYHKLIDYLDRQVSKAVLGQTMTTDDGSSLAQAQVHAEVRGDILRADARALEATLARDLIAPIVRLNLGDAPAPRFTLHTEDPEDAAALADQIAKLAQAGVVIPQAWVRERFSIPEPQADEAVIGTRPDPLAAQAKHFRGVTKMTAHAVHPDGDPTPTTAQADTLDREAAAAWREIFDRIREIVERATTLEELRDNLLAAYGDLPTERLAEVMATAFAAAELAGRFDVSEEGDSNG